MKNTKKATKSTKKSVLAVKSKVKAGLYSGGSTGREEGGGAVCKANVGGIQCC
jgi:hypothetical protein